MFLYMHFNEVDKTFLTLFTIKPFENIIVFYRAWAIIIKCFQTLWVLCLPTYFLHLSFKFLSLNNKKNC